MVSSRRTTTSWVLCVATLAQHVLAFNLQFQSSSVIVGGIWDLRQHQRSPPRCRSHHALSSFYTRQKLPCSSRRNYWRQEAASTNNNEKNAQEDGPAATGNLLRTLTGPEFSIALGVSILLAVLTNRLATPELIDSQARTDILGVMASGGLITNGVYLLDLNVKTAEEVTLVGRFLQEYSPSLVPSARRDLQWLAESLLLASPTTTVVVYRGGQALARVGVVGESPVVQDAPILQRCIREGKYGRELYLPALQVLPGKIEFDYLPENCQGVLMQPVLDGSAVVIIGTNRARAFSPKDIAWIKGLCDQAALSLRQAIAI